MKLQTLIQDIAQPQIIGHGPAIDLEVGTVRDDSRHVKPGDLFVALRGLNTDGHHHIHDAVHRGARVVVSERPTEGLVDAEVTQVVVADSAQALGSLAARAYGSAAQALKLIAITGTNGKTTTTFVLESILRAAGHNPGVIGTVNYRYGGRSIDAPYTTPTPLVLHRVLADMRAAHCTHVLIEASSIALAMQRLAALQFDVAAFTNLTQDHLDVHGDMEHYRQAKELLFRRHLSRDGIAVIYADDPAAAAMVAAAGNRDIRLVSTHGEGSPGNVPLPASSSISSLISSSISSSATSAPASAALKHIEAAYGAHANISRVQLTHAQSSVHGVRADFATATGSLSVQSDHLIGDYNIANLAVVVAVAEAIGIEHEAIARGIADMPGVPGRVERVANQRGLNIFVDYAHTPDALRNVLSALRPLTQRRLICVFGCGGDRDAAKRPQMGAAVAELADLAVVTSDNPRTEPPQAIIDAILPAVPQPFFVDVDRRTAIAAAVHEATPGDIVLIAGKGHEDYQILGTDKIHFDDREEAARAAQQRWDFAAADIARICDGHIVQAPNLRQNDPSQNDGGSSDGHRNAFTRISIDGRHVAAGDLYVAIVGESLDGHDFCDQAIAAGATGVLIARGRSRELNLPSHATVIEVDDPRKALGRIARWHRRRWAAYHQQTGFEAPLIAITGSTGKTTTKDLLAAALAAKWRVHANRGSFNNETGVPLTLLGLRPYHQAAVIEMGMRGLGQIDYLARIAEPTVAAVVNAGIAHVGVVGSADAIVRGKSEIYASLPPSGTAVYPGDDDRLKRYAVQAPHALSFGSHLPPARGDLSGARELAQEPPAYDVCAIEYKPHWHLTPEHGPEHTPEHGPEHDNSIPTYGGADVTFAVGDSQYTGRLLLPGRHVASNAACALACARAAGADIAIALPSLARTRPSALRGQIEVIAGRNVLVDCYNANPTSTLAALDTVSELSRAQRHRAVAILGDMLELGDETEMAHRRISREAARRRIYVVAMGEQRSPLISSGGVSTANAEDAAALALSRTSPGDWILVKASRALALERVVEAMRQSADVASPVSPGEGAE